MGIPSYFAHVVRRHRAIIKRADPKRTPIDNLYMDCNSLIYDAVREIDPPSKDGVSAFETRLIEEVCRRIEHYVSTLKPRCRLFVAFDGVAPVAKLEQQRSRRYKSWLQSRVVSLLDGKPAPSWSTAAITPGTAFMHKLGETVHKRLDGRTCIGEQRLDISVVSGPGDAGEGEHKIYQYIRDFPEHHGETSTVIYGMDADLFMLTLNHLHVAPRSYLFREMPDFIRSLDRSLDPMEGYMVDIPLFAEALSHDLAGSRKLTPDRRGRLISDYILLCFLLGNDFLPHFPALNIRTRGIDRVMGAYTKVAGSRNRYVVDGARGRVNWPVLREVLSCLANSEHDFILEEYETRARQSRRPNRGKGSEEGLMSLPLENRGDELYINPEQPGWQERYYRTLFDFEISDVRRQQVCINYLEGLEWTYKYYTTGCIDWRWCYHYDYPPLLEDLIRYVPALHVPVLEPGDTGPVDELAQLSYVLPSVSLSLIPQGLRDVLLCEHAEWYTPIDAFKWAFCKYFWEAHPVLEPICLEELGKVVSKYRAGIEYAH